MSPEVRETIDRVRNTGHLPDGSRGCLLCGDECPNEQMHVDMWMPNWRVESAVGSSGERQDNGGTILLIYQLCPSCFKQPSKDRDVETEAHRQMRVMGVE